MASLFSKFSSCKKFIKCILMYHDDSINEDRYEHYMVRLGSVDSFMTLVHDSLDDASDVVFTFKSIHSIPSSISRDRQYYLIK